MCTARWVCEKTNIHLQFCPTKCRAWRLLPEKPTEQLLHTVKYTHLWQMRWIWTFIYKNMHSKHENLQYACDKQSYPNFMVVDAPKNIYSAKLSREHFMCAVKSWTRANLKLSWSQLMRAYAYRFFFTRMLGQVLKQWRTIDVAACGQEDRSPTILTWSPTPWRPGVMCLVALLGSSTPASSKNLSLHSAVPSSATVTRWWAQTSIKGWS